MKFLVWLLCNLALSSSSFDLIEKNTPVYKVVQHESFEIDFGSHIQGLKVCNISKDNHDLFQRCIYKSQNSNYKGQCPRVRFMGNESRCQCFNTFFFVTDMVDYLSLTSFSHQCCNTHHKYTWPYYTHHNDIQENHSEYCKEEATHSSNNTLI
jgi:hypothetical protein